MKQAVLPNRDASGDEGILVDLEATEADAAWNTHKARERNTLKQ